MIIKNGRIRYITTEIVGDHGRDEHGNVVEDTRSITDEYDCNMEVKTRTYYAGGETETFTQAVYTILVESQPPANATTALLTQVDGVDAGEVKIVNVEPLKAVRAYRLTCHANQR